MPPATKATENDAMKAFKRAIYNENVYTERDRQTSVVWGNKETKTRNKQTSTTYN